MTAATRAARIWKAALALAAAFIIVHDLSALSRWELALVPGAAGTLGMWSGRSYLSGVEVTRLEKDSPLAAAGVKVGDRVLFDRRADRMRILEAGERIGLTVNRGGEARHIEVAARGVDEVSWADIATTITSWIATLLMFCVGVLIGWRRADSLPMRMLSASLLSQTMVMFYPMLPPGALHALSTGLAGFMALAAYVCFLYFVLSYTRLLDRPWIARAFYAYAALDVTLTIARSFTRLGYADVPPAFSEVATILSIAAALASMTGLLLGWRRATGVRRERLAWLSLCMGSIYSVYVFSVGLQGLAYVKVFDSFEMIWDAFNLGAGIVMCAANAGLGYAVLRHRILDFGFAVNRALVYGTTSIILAALFMLAAQLINRVIRFEAREHHIVMDIAIGLALALLARQVVRWVDPRVQKIFFRRWHAAAAKLQRFRVDRIHGIPPEAIRAEFVDAVREYTGADGCAIYLADDDGSLRRRNSTMRDTPAQIPPDQPLAVRLLSEDGPQRLAAAEAGLQAALALPMKAHGRLIGAVLVGPRADDDPSRPDEIAQLATSATQVGLELELRRLRQLESQLEQARPPRRRKNRNRQASGAR